MPNLDELKTILRTIKRRVDYEYFFDNINSPEWFEHIKAEGLLKDPDKPVFKDGGVMFPVWPPVQYLIKIADKRPMQVLEIIKGTKTENIRVYEDFVQAALNMPADYAAQVIPMVKEWLRNPYVLSLWEKLSKLLSKLANEGQEEAALSLSDIILDVQKRPEETENKIGFNKAIPFVRGEWEYSEILKRSLMVLVNKTGERAVKLLCDKLHKTIEIEDRTRPEDFRDLSAIWRSSIEDSSQNHPSGLKNILVTASRIAAHNLLKNDKTKLEPLVIHLRGRPLPIFSRLALHLVNEFSEDNTLPARFIFDDILFDSIEVWHEYALLLQKWFPKLSDSNKKILLNKIDRIFSQKNRKLAPSIQNERDDRLVRYYYLTMLQEYLEGTWKEKLQKSKEEFGELDHPTFHSYKSCEWVGPQSPKPKDELSKLLLPALREYLIEWKPKKERFGYGPSVEGLGRELQTVVKERAVEFCGSLDVFKISERTYVRSIIQGFGDAIKQGEGKDFFRNLNWNNILNYCIWASSQSQPIEREPEDDDDRDPNWSWTRQAVARFLEYGFQSDSIPIEVRDLAWKALVPVLSDPDPTSDSEEKYLKDDEFWQMAINTTRGTGLETVVFYGLWVVRGLSLKGENRNFDYYPEVREILERHLDIKVDPSKSVRSVYGRWLPWLFVLDDGWATNNLDKIFPADIQLEKYYRSAWLTYITFCDAFDNVFKKTRPYYEKMLDHIRGQSEEKYSYQSPETRYVDHLMIFYWRGLISLDDTIIVRLFGESEVDLRKQAISFSGRSLEAIKDEIHPDVRERLLRLMAFRFEKLKNCQNLAEKSELSEFGWWLISGHFEISWVLDKVEEILSICGNISPDHMIMGYLRHHASSYPEKIISCLNLIVKHAVGRQGFYGWMEESKEIFSKVLASRSPKAAQIAEDLIHQLGARGYQSFEKLLRSQSE